MVTASTFPGRPRPRHRRVQRRRSHQRLRRFRISTRSCGDRETTLGITVGDLSDQLAQYFGTKDGVLVTSVADDSAAAKAGVKAGDVITSFNGTDVTSPSNLRSRIQRLQDGDEFTVGVVRDKKSMTLKGKAETLRPHRTTRTVI